MSYWTTHEDELTDSQVYDAAEQASEDLQLCEALEVAEYAMLWQDAEDSLLCKALDEAEVDQAETAAAAAVLQHLNNQAEQARARFDVHATLGETAEVFQQESAFDVAETAAATAILQ